MSMGGMPCSFMERAWSGLSRRARMPPWTLGWSVFTRPSIISGKPVNSETSVTTTPFSLRSCAVPPVERISTPWVRSALAKSTSPVLSEALRSARRILMGDISRSPRSRALVEAVLLQFFPQRVPVEAQELGGARLVALRLEHHHLEHGPLDRAHDHLVDAGALLP